MLYCFDTYFHFICWLFAIFLSFLWRHDMRYYAVDMSLPYAFTVYPAIWRFLSYTLFFFIFCHIAFVIFFSFSQIAFLLFAMPYFLRYASASSPPRHAAFLIFSPTAYVIATTLFSAATATPHCHAFFHGFRWYCRFFFFQLRRRFAIRQPCHAAVTLLAYAIQPCCRRW